MRSTVPTADDEVEGLFEELGTIPGQDLSEGLDEQEAVEDGGRGDRHEAAHDAADPGCHDDPGQEQDVARVAEGFQQEGLAQDCEGTDAQAGQGRPGPCQPDVAGPRQIRHGALRGPPPRGGAAHVPTFDLGLVHVRRIIHAAVKTAAWEGQVGGGEGERKGRAARRCRPARTPRLGGTLARAASRQRADDEDRDDGAEDDPRDDAHSCSSSPATRAVVS